MMRRLACLLATAPLCLTAAVAAEDPAAIGRRARAYELYGRAQWLLLERSESAAADTLDQAIASDPSPDLLLEAADLRAALGELDRADALVAQALAERPGWSAALVERAEILLARARDADDPQAYLDRAIDSYRAAAAAEPGSERTVRRLAELLARGGHPDEAIARLESFAGSGPLPEPLALLLARLYLHAGRLADAENLLRTAAAGGGSEALDLLAGVYESQGQYDDAIALVAPLAGAGEGRAAIDQRLGRLQLLAGRARDAVPPLEAARDANPGDAKTLLLLTQAYEGAGDLPHAVETCDRLLVLEPGNLEGRFHHARLLRTEGDLAGARATFEALVREGSGRDLGDREATVVAVAYAQLGVLAMSTHDWPGAAGALEQALGRSKDPRPDLVLLLARARMEAGDLDGAERAANAGAERSPDALDLQALHAEILIQRGHPEEARAWLATMIENEGRSVEAYISAAEALMHRKDYAAAVDLLHEGLRRHADDDRLEFARGAALERLGRIGDAERALGRAVTINPKNAMALNYLGYMLADNDRRLEQAAAFVERALAIDPDNPAYLDSLGWVLFKQARYAPAEEKLRAALRYDSYDPAIREHLGDLLIATGRPEEAVQEWQAAIQCGHDDPDRIRGKLGQVRARLNQAR